MYTCFSLLAFIIFEMTFLKINFKYKSCITLIHPSQILLWGEITRYTFIKSLFCKHISYDVLPWSYFLIWPGKLLQCLLLFKCYAKLLIQNRTKQLRFLSHCRSLPNVKMNFCFKMFFVVLYFTIRIIQICMSSKMS